ncbi:MAG: oxalate:formate antiporter [Oscillospiraceae bacterium]|jgi:hypothetical protein|nr:oxalate:formate antiporter [Oscillospiraceae bacterium]
MITSGQQLFINRALPVFKRDPRVLAVALGGSYIRKETMDEYSGLDFVIAVNPADLESVLRDRAEIAGRLGPLLASFTGEHIQRPELLICLYDEPVIHVDLSFIPIGDAARRYDDPVILYQEGSALSDEYAKEPVRTPEPDMQWYEDRFWIWVHFAATRVGRGELFAAIDSLDFLRLNVLGPLIQMKSGRPPRGVRNIERDSPEDAPRLAATVAQYDAKSCVRALKAAADLYISLRGVNKSRLYLRDEAEKRALRYLSYISEKFLYA